MIIVFELTCEFAKTSGIKNVSVISYPPKEDMNSGFEPFLSEERKFSTFFRTNAKFSFHARNCSRNGFEV